MDEPREPRSRAGSDQDAGDLLVPRRADIWARRALFSAFALATIPYFQLLNRLEVHGGELLNQLPGRGVVLLANHQTYFAEAIAFFDLLYRRRRVAWEDPFLRFSAAEETMRKNVATSVLTKAGAVTFRRSHREGGTDLRRPVDLDGIGRIEQAIRSGWLLHFPTGTTRPGAPIRPGVARLLHGVRPVVVPVRVDGFRELLLYKQIPGRIGRQLSIRIHEPMDLDQFYADPYTPEAGAQFVRRLAPWIEDPIAAQGALNEQRSTSPDGSPEQAEAPGTGA
jgi:1-acyl-sn-glycerol-3-phosphate acyltransferase